MNKSPDNCPLALLFALSLLLNGLAIVMADDKVQPAKVIKAKDARKDGPPSNGCGKFASMVPSFCIKDPLGKEHQSEELYKKAGMLIMLTVPNLTQYEKQKRWDKYLSKEAWPVGVSPARVVLEDLSQQQTFKDKVRMLMRKKYKPDGGVVVVVDEDGDVRRNFRVQNNETVILLADSEGNIIHHERDEVDPDQEAARRVLGQITKLAAQAVESAPAVQTQETVQPQPLDAALLLTTPLPAAAK